jgi:hypothetical protein
VLGAAALAALSLFPLAAAAQAVEISWRPAPAPSFETVPLPLYFLSGGALLEDYAFAPRPALRLIDAFEDSDSDRDHRLEQLAQCSLLGEIRGQSTLDVLCGIPNGMIDLLSGGLRRGPAVDEVVSLRLSKDRSLLPRLLACPIDDAGAHPFDDLLGQLLIREQRYFARFQDSSLSTFAVEEGLSDIDRSALMEDQNKLLFDACRRVYFGRFGTRLDEKIRDEAIDITRWHPVDFVVAPAMIAGYLYIRGWEKRVDLLGLKCTFQMEPLRRIMERFEGSRNDLVSAASLEIGVGNFPLKAIVSVGILEGDAIIDFVGIGTSLGKAKQIVTQEMQSLQGFE